MIKGKNSKGGDRTQLYLSQEKAKELGEILSILCMNEKGVKLDLHISRKRTNDGAREFDSAIAFIKPVMDAPGGYGGGGGMAPKAPAAPRMNDMDAIKKQFGK